MTDPQTQESKDDIDVPIVEGTFMELSQIDIEEVVESEASQNHLLLVMVNECEPLPPTVVETDSEGKENIHNMNDIGLHKTPSRKCTVTPNSSANKKWDVTSRRNLKSRKYPALIANVPKKSLFDELTQAKLQLVHLQKSFLEAEIIEKKKVWAFEENERKKESEFKEKERKWKQEEYKIKLERNFK